MAISYTTANCTLTHAYSIPKLIDNLQHVNVKIHIGGPTVLNWNTPATTIKEQIIRSLVNLFLERNDCLLEMSVIDAWLVKTNIKNRKGHVIRWKEGEEGILNVNWLYLAQQRYRAITEGRPLPVEPVHHHHIKRRKKTNGEAASEPMEPVGSVPKASDYVAAETSASRYDARDPDSLEEETSKTRMIGLLMNTKPGYGIRTLDLARQAECKESTVSANITKIKLLGYVVQSFLAPEGDSRVYSIDRSTVKEGLPLFNPDGHRIDQDGRRIDRNGAPTHDAQGRPLSRPAMA